ncbi:MAG: TonB family protein [Alphaproteobacteria bacterium GM202ARS2]|nr:TonB family protein [Alphaproteobacteria bacterium GM202ARS2]
MVLLKGKGGRMVLSSYAIDSEQRRGARLYGLCFVVSVLVHGAFLLFFGVVDGTVEEPLEAPRPPSLRLSLSLPQEVVAPEPPEQGLQDREVEEEQEVVQPSALSAPREQAQVEETYMTELYRSIDRHKVYPRVALRRSLEADIILLVTLDKRGGVVDIVVEQGTSMIFIDAARQAILDAAPFEPFPEGMAKETLTIRVPMLYRQGGGL